MGKMIYGAPMWSVDFDDRVLAHLRVVILAKLRRGESFSFGWQFDTSRGSGRGSVWMHPAIPLGFEFFGGREPALNREWIEALMLSANSPQGLAVVPEPDGTEPTKLTGTRG